MTTFDELPVTCAVCGTTSVHPILMSTNSFGSPDLDLRPAEMQRSTVWMWVQRCPQCGYCADSLDKAGDGADAVTASASYREQLVDPGLPELAVSFVCQHSSSNTPVDLPTPDGRQFTQLGFVTTSLSTNELATFA